jgi:hypothetical protein
LKNLPFGLKKKSQCKVGAEEGMVSEEISPIRKKPGTLHETIGKKPEVPKELARSQHHRLKGVKDFHLRILFCSLRAA